MVLTLYQSCMAQWEYRNIFTFLVCMMVIRGFGDLIITMGWNLKLGISNIAWIAIEKSIFGPFVMMLHLLPGFVLIAKITPAHVEATVFSFAASVINFGMHFGIPYMGLAWNKLFFHVDKENLSDNLWKLNVLEICSAVACFVYLPLIPS